MIAAQEIVGKPSEIRGFYEDCVEPDGAPENGSVVRHAPAGQFLAYFARGVLYQTGLRSSAGIARRPAVPVCVAPTPRTGRSSVRDPYPDRTACGPHRNGRPAGGGAVHRDRRRPAGSSPESISAALELSRRVDGGTRSWNGWRIRGGKSHTAVPRFVIGVGMFLYTPYRHDDAKAVSGRTKGTRAITKVSIAG